VIVSAESDPIRKFLLEHSADRLQIASGTLSGHVSRPLAEWGADG
jgi:hypothetical protein